MKIAEVYWADTTEWRNQTAKDENTNPMVNLISVGYFMGRFKDRNGTEYVKICHKRSIDSEGNDDYMVIPAGCIRKVIFTQ